MTARNPNIEDQKCAEPSCERTFRQHRWGATKAHVEGWFMQKDGTAWCPDHVPEWVEEWRDYQARKKRERNAGT